MTARCLLVPRCSAASCPAHGGLPKRSCYQRGFDPPRLPSRPRLRWGAGGLSAQLPGIAASLLGRPHAAGAWVGTGALTVLVLFLLPASFSSWPLASFICFHGFCGRSRLGGRPWALRTDTASLPTWQDLPFPPSRFANADIIFLFSYHILLLSLNRPPPLPLPVVGVGGWGLRRWEGSGVAGSEQYPRPSPEPRN